MQQVNKGIILYPTKELTLDIVDSGLTGLWQKEYAQLNGNVLSCTGFTILFGGCPTIWASKLQTEISFPPLKRRHPPP
jgi:hypothetical protein